MAVACKRAHAEFFGQGEGLLVVGFGQLDAPGDRRAAISPRRRRAYAWAAFLVNTGSSRALPAKACASSKWPASSCASPRERLQSA